MYCNSDNGLAGLIREIRNDFLYVPGFELSELEEFVYVASTFWSIIFTLYSLCAYFRRVLKKKK